MSEVRDQWQKELKLLLDRLQAHPEGDHAADRERIAVLNRLIAAEPQSAA